MKDLIIIMLIVGSVVGGSFYSLHFYRKTYQMMSEDLELLMENIYIDNHQEETIKRIENDWLKVETWLIILQDHASIDYIESDLYECFHYYRMQDKEKLVLYKDKTLSGLEDLIKREEVLLVDIL